MHEVWEEEQCGHYDLHGIVSKDEHRGITRTRYVNRCKDFGFYSEWDENSLKGLCRRVACLNVWFVSQVYW